MHIISCKLAKMFVTLVIPPILHLNFRVLREQARHGLFQTRLPETLVDDEEEGHDQEGEDV